MQLSFTVDVPFDIPTLRFALERDYREFAKGRLVLSCFFDKGREMFGLALLPKTLDDVGRCAQLLAKSAAWTVEFLERWPRDEETGRLRNDGPEVAAFLTGRPLFCHNAPGQSAALESEENWKAT
jgi:hypothetical protein